MEHLRTLFGHHVWATLALLDRCLELSTAELELTTPGGFGTIAATLEHIVRSDKSYQRRILGEPPPAERDRSAPVAVLRDEMERQGRGWEEVLDRLDGLDMSLPPFPDDDPPYPAVEHAVGLLLAQAIHHGHEHRAHVCSILGSHGLTVPDLSAWEYVRLGIAEGWY